MMSTRSDIEAAVERLTRRLVMMDDAGVTDSIERTAITHEREELLSALQLARNSLYRTRDLRSW